MTDANGKKNTIIADNKHICYDDFKPDDTIMPELFENLLDHHPNSVYPQDKKKRSEKCGVKKYEQKMPCQETAQTKEEKSKEMINLQAYSSVISHGNYSFY